MKPIEWKSKRSDVLVLVGLYFLIITGLLILFALRGARHDRTDSAEKFLQHLSSPSYIFMAFIFGGIAYSPLFAFRHKVPRKIVFDPEQGLLIIQRRYTKKEQLIALDGIGYVYYDRGIFVVLEIYHSFETSRRGFIRKRFRTIAVPFWGMAINRRDLKEIVQRLKQHGGIAEPRTEKRSLYDLMND